MPTRILFVDDEPNIRRTLPAILRQHGFQVTAVGSVAEAIQRLSSQPYDVLIADLNIGEPGDGFTVVSAMRRTRPNCVNIILTGYPAFEHALRAIRAQVDDFIVKPADIDGLLQTIEHNLANPERLHAERNQPLIDFLGQHRSEVVGRALERMKADPNLSRLPLSDRDRVDHITVLLADIVARLQSDLPSPAANSDAGARHGLTRKRQGYSLPMLVDDIRAIDAAVYDIVRHHLLDIDVSTLLHDLSRLNDALERQLQESLQAFVGEVVA
ncbi:MAG TPA: response regulator [Terriglobales bacterium]|nr:response regulator [Terriglobales bacterium]